ncbi:XAC2610-related protein [Mucilaginibacter pedocola]|uniref:Uncharacterized protein n=1 Tax=Mucilaginibacter pedocola TaxID=1792845 RepID=A0A1S9PAH6_9SPHI|nr:hypothetical protein [Mucilaginibacter pedocola]OOQ57962.1 hypothetical protein BC343_09825 [Mucilaginibacter pedocola]
MYKYLFLFTLFIISCKGEHRPVAISSAKRTIETALPTQLATKIAIRDSLIESFTDSTHIGRKKHNKFELKRYALGDSIYVVIRFWCKQNNKWSARNEFRFPKNMGGGCNPQISDFNNDGLKDVTYISNEAARGANEVRTLFIYDNKNDRLIHIKNSERFPNMEYNSTLNCIDALLFSGCTATVFAKLEADSLRTFASVEQCDSIRVCTYNKNGIEKRILTKPAEPDVISRFRNYKPLEEY